MLRGSHLIATLLIMASSPAALAQKSSGYMNLEDMSDVYGTQLAVFRVMFSTTDAICPRQTGVFRIRPDGRVTDIVPILWGFGPDWRTGPTAAPDDFTYRRRIETDSCRIDIDISEQQQLNGNWISLISPLARGPEAILEEGAPPASSQAENEISERDIRARREIFERDIHARKHAGNLLQGWTSTTKSFVGFEGGGAKNCFDAVATFLIDRSGVTLLFPTGIGEELNRFFIERVDNDTDHSMLSLSRGSCRVSFIISAATLRDSVWAPLPIAPPWQK